MQLQSCSHVFQTAGSYDWNVLDVCIERVEMYSKGADLEHL